MLPVTESSLRISLPIWCALLCLVLLTIWLRWDVYPQTYFADELIPRAVVKHMQVSHSLDTNWDNADWHGDYAGGFYKLKQYNFSSYHTALLLVRESANLLGLADIPDLVLYRAVSVIFQLACLVLVFLIANSLANAYAGLLATAFMAVIPQAVVDAHYARPESFVMLLIALASWLAFRAHSERNWRYALPEAFIWGVAFSCKFSFFPIILLACAANLFRFRSARLLLAWCASFVAGIAISAPYILLDFSGFLHGVGLLLNQYAPQAAESGWMNKYLPSASQLFPYLTSFFGLPVLCVIVASVFQRNKIARYFSLASLLVSIFYLLLFARQGVFFERNLSHLLPLWAVMFALGFLVVFQFIKQHWYFWLIAVLFFIWPLYLSMQIENYFFRGMGLVKQDVSRYEEGVQAQFSATKIIPFQFVGNMQLETMNNNDIVRVPQYKLSGMTQVNAALTKAGFIQVAYIDLPLSFLPYNQLQMNQLPPAYAYYQRDVANKMVQP